MIVTIIFILYLIILIFLKYESFSLPNSHHVYMNYRKLIDNRHITQPKTFYFPGKISDNCFSDIYNKCYGNNNLCQKLALSKCEGPPMISSRFV